MSTNSRPADSVTLRLVALRPAGAEAARFSYTATVATTTAHTIVLATDHAAGREVILKQARPHAAAGAQLRLAAEAAMLRFLARRQIAAPRFVALFEHDGRACLAMSRVPGLTLEALQQRGLASPELVVRSLARLCGTLARLHCCGYLHHDIKPANIVVQPDLTPVLIDWATAEAIRPTGARGRVGGLTPGFASPEQLRGLALPSNDLYAVGATLAELVEWPGARLAQIIARATGQAAPRYTRAADLAHDLAQLCLIDCVVDMAGLRAI